MSDFSQIIKRESIDDDQRVDRHHSAFVSDQLAKTEKHYERDDSPESREGLNDIFAGVERAKYLTHEFNGEQINHHDEILDFINEQIQKYLDAHAQFTQAIESLDDLKACLGARKLRAAVDLLASIHPKLIKSRARESADILLEGWLKLKKEKLSNPEFVHNILLRHLFLSTASKVLEFGCKDVSPQNYQERMIEQMTLDLEQERAGLRVKAEDVEDKMRKSHELDLQLFRRNLEIHYPKA